MNRTGTSLHLVPGRWAQAFIRWAEGWWVVVNFGAQMLVVVLTPSSYRRSQRRVIYHHLYAATAPVLPAFVVISALVSLVIIRIVLATASSYGWRCCSPTSQSTDLPLGVLPPTPAGSGRYSIRR